jgi:hypothetical protein
MHRDISIIACLLALTIMMLAATAQDSATSPGNNTSMNNSTAIDANVSNITTDSTVADDAAMNNTTEPDGAPEAALDSSASPESAVANDTDDTAPLENASLSTPEINATEEVAPALELGNASQKPPTPWATASRPQTTSMCTETSLCTT